MWAPRGVYGHENVASFHLPGLDSDSGAFVKIDPSYPSGGPLHPVATQFQGVQAATLRHSSVLVRFGVEFRVRELVCRNEYGFLFPIDEVAALQPLETRHDNLRIGLRFRLGLVSAQDLPDNDPHVAPGA